MLSLDKQKKNNLECETRPNRKSSFDYYDLLLGNKDGPKLERVIMKYNKVFFIAVCLIVLACFLVLSLGATDAEKTLTPQDKQDMVRIVDAYWRDTPLVWPIDEQTTAPISEEVSNELNARYDSALDKYVAPDSNFAKREQEIDPAGFLNETRKGGLIVLSMGYKIIKVADPIATEDNIAIMEIDIWDWSEEDLCDSKGMLKNDIQKVDATNRYRYTFEKVDGFWLIADSKLLTIPLDSNEKIVAPEKITRGDIVE